MEKIIEELNKLVSRVIDGNTDALKAYKMLRELSEIVNTNLDAVYEYAMSEAEKYDPRELAENGITIRSTGRWDYSNCYEWITLKNRMKELEKQLQARAKITHDILDTDTGEILDKPSYIPSKKSIVFTKHK